MPPQVAEFEKTQMGKIGKTPQGRGKFECENCHGPGSAHVKAGGGRGIGGILSFEHRRSPFCRKNKNAICLACHRKRRAQLLGRQRPRNARGRLHRLPHRDEETWHASII